MCLPWAGSIVGSLQDSNAVCNCWANWRCGSPIRRGAPVVCSPQETYNYYYLPFCKPSVPGKPKHKWGGLGEVLQGNELIDSQLEVKFRSQCCISFSMLEL